MDAFVGGLLTQLAEDRLLDQTIVIHTSDHGGVNPRSKRYCYDEGLHVPLIIAAPGRYADLFPARGTRVKAAVSTIRIPPTLIHLAGGEVPSYMQGRTLAEAEFDDTRELAFGMRNRMDERYDMMRTVRDSRFRYIRNYYPHRPYGQHQGYAWLAAGYRSWEREHPAACKRRSASICWRSMTMDSYQREHPKKVTQARNQRPTPYRRFSPWPTWSHSKETTTVNGLSRP